MISRVHLMLRIVGGRLYAFDLASTGRTFVPGNPAPIRVHHLAGASELHLARNVAFLRWHPVR